MPSFAVETDGTLHTSLMRSCTGWPSGIWIDEPRRTAPDGSNFQLQHWTHAFDYAVVSGDGDWRDAEIPARSAEFSRAAAGRDGAPRVTARLPASGSLLQIEPAGSVHLGALKAAGNPLAQGSAHAVDPGRVAVRLVETRGGDTDVVVRSAAGHGLASCDAADLLERPLARAPRLTALHGYEIAPRWPDSTCPGCSTPNAPRWRRTPKLPAALRAVLAAQPRARAAGRAAGGRAPAPAPGRPADRAPTWRCASRRPATAPTHR